MTYNSEDLRHACLQWAVNIFTAMCSLNSHPIETPDKTVIDMAEVFFKFVKGESEEAE